MENLFNKINEAVAFIKNVHTPDAQIAVVLGSGLGSFTEKIQIEKEIAYQDIPHFPVSTVKGHTGKMIFGQIGSKKVIALAGRFHFYEGYSAQEVVFPIRVLKYLGVNTLLLSNAAGAVNKDYKIGDLMIIKDHISFFTPNPLVGKNDDEIGPRFPDMNEPYSSELRNIAKEIALANNIDLKEGVYVAVTGPTFETKAEYKLIHILGGDVVGMSTVQENIAAVHMGMRVFAMSVVTDIAIYEEGETVSHEEVLKAAKNAEPVFTEVFTKIIESI